MKLCKEHKANAKKAFKIATTDHDVRVLVNPISKSVLAYQRAFKNSKMIAVSVSFMDASETDKFRKWTGIYFALERLGDGEYVQLPLGHLWDDRQALADYLQFMFVI